ncbi:MAG: hypothetical protein R6U43_02110 [Candidatus Krumholzibacteriales bacterium]
MKARTAALLLIFLVGCGGGGGSSEVPDKLIGRWETDNPRYKGCFLELEKNSVTFVPGEGRVSVNSLKKIELSREEGSQLYTLFYTGGADRNGTLKLYYESSGGGVIRLKSRKQIEWTRKDS